MLEGLVFGLIVMLIAVLDVVIELVPPALHDCGDGLVDLLVEEVVHLGQDSVELAVGHASRLALLLAFVEDQLVDAVPDFVHEQLVLAAVREVG
jgi:hypothetical protein